MSLSNAEWHQRYIQQAGWTADLRRLIYSYPWFIDARLIIELGCGTGAILQEFSAFEKQCVVGLDINRSPLLFASSKDPSLNLTQGDALTTPFSASIFDICFCHYLLLWTKRPDLIIKEMMRITKNSGWILALAEPDYGGRIDYPFELRKLGEIQINSLFEQGANPLVGRTLKSLFMKSGMTEVVCGILGAQWSIFDKTENSLESKILLSDYISLSNSPAALTTEQFNTLRQIDRQAWKDQTRILFVPTFFAWGKVNKG